MKLISSNQVKALYTIATNNGWSHDEVHEIIRKVKKFPENKVVSAKNILVEEYENITEILLQGRDELIDDLDSILSLVKAFDGAISDKPLMNVIESMDEVEIVEDDLEIESETETVTVTLSVNNFNADQMLALTRLQDFTNTQGSGQFRLLGSAGTGKSYVAAKIIKILSEIPGNRIAIAAPTHAAKKVICDYVANNDGKIDGFTVHSVLGLGIAMNENTGKTENAKQEGDWAKIPLLDYNILFVDESYCCNKDVIEEMLSHLNNRSSFFSPLKVVWMGDPYQLAPVGEDMSVLHGMNLPTTELTTVMRYHGALAELVAMAKLCVMTNKRFNIETALNSVQLDDTITVIKDKRRYRELMDTLFCSEDYESNNNYARLIAFRNSIVDESAFTLRRDFREWAEIEDDSEFSSGDLLLSAKSYVNGFGIPIMNGDYFQVRESEKCKLVWDEPMSASRMVYDGYKLTGDIIGGSTGVEIQQPSIKSMIKIKEQLENYRRLAVSAKDARNERRLLWACFYSLNKRFPDLKYSHAITTHKSQGSSFNHPVIFANDLNSCKDKNTHARLWYVALSRARTCANIYFD